MERLTFEGNFCDIAQCCELPCPYDNNCMQKQVWERLKSYEDTRLSPEGLKQACEIEEYLNERGNSIARVAELIKADYERRVVVLPCRVGDTLWLTASYYTERLPQPMEARVVRIKIDAGDAITYATDRRRVGDKEIGRTVFLTREEAEKALEAKNGNQ